MAIQNRRGNYTDFDPTKMVAGEFAVVQNGDPDGTDGEAVYFAPKAGKAKRLVTADDVRNVISGELEDIIAETEAALADDVQRAEDAADSVESSVTQIATNTADIADIKEDLNVNVDLLLDDKIIKYPATSTYLGDYLISSTGTVAVRTSAVPNAVVYVIDIRNIEHLILHNANAVAYFSEYPALAKTAIDSTRHFGMNERVINVASEIPSNVNYFAVQNNDGNEVTATSLDSSIREEMAAIEDDTSIHDINIMPAGSASATVNGVLCQYENGALKITGTSTTFGGRNVSIIRFTMKAGTYSWRAPWASGIIPSSKLAVFICNASDASILIGFGTTGTLTLPTDTNVWLSINTGDAGTVYDYELKLQLSKSDKPIDTWFAPSPILTAKDTISRSKTDKTIYRRNKLFAYAMENVLCIGDSLTAGGTWTTDWGDGHTISPEIAENYPHVLGRMINGTVTNAGFSGITVDQWWGNKFSNYTYSDYDTILVWLGTNQALTDTLDTDVNPYNDYHDYADTATGNYCKIIEGIIDEHGKTGDYDGCLVALITIFGGIGDAETTNKVIYKIGAKYGLPVIDMTMFGQNTYPEFRGIKSNLHYGKAGSIWVADKVITELGNWFADDPLRCEYGYLPKTTPH